MGVEETVSGRSLALAQKRKRTMELRFTGDIFIVGTSSDGASKSCQIVFCQPFPFEAADTWYIDRDDLSVPCTLYPGCFAHEWSRWGVGTKVRVSDMNVYAARIEGVESAAASQGGKSNRGGRESEACIVVEARTVSITAMPTCASEVVKMPPERFQALLGELSSNECTKPRELLLKFYNCLGANVYIPLICVLFCNLLASNLFHFRKWRAQSPFWCQR